MFEHFPSTVTRVWHKPLTMTEVFVPEVQVVADEAPGARLVAPVIVFPSPATIVKPVNVCVVGFE